MNSLQVRPRKYWDGHHWWLYDGHQWRVDPGYGARHFRFAAVLAITVAAIIASFVITSWLTSDFDEQGVVAARVVWLAAVTVVGGAAALISRLVRKAIRAAHRGQAPAAGLYLVPSLGCAQWWDGSQFADANESKAYAANA